MADAEYVVNIAASMPEGPLTISQLDALTAGIEGGRRGAEHFQQAIQQVSASLSVARAAQASANEALSAGALEYRQLESATLKVEKAAAKAAQKNAGVIPPELAAEVAAGRAGLDAMAASMRGLELAADHAGAEVETLTQTQANIGTIEKHVSSSLGGATSSLSTFRGALGDVGGPLGQLGEKALFPAQAFADLREKFGGATAAATVAVVGFVAVAAAIAAVGVAAVVGAGRLAIWSVGLADSARSADLTTQALEAQTPALAAMRDEVNALARETGVGGDALRGMVKDLMAAGVTAGDLPAALRATALEASALGNSGADFIASMRESKGAVGDLAAETTSKFGGIVAQRMRGLDKQTDLLQSSFSDLFSGLDIDPVLDGMSTIVAMFDKTSVTGQTLKWLFESVFQPLIDNAQNAAYVVEAFAIGFQIGLLRAYLAARPAIEAITAFFGFDSTSLTDVLTSATTVGEVAAGIFVTFASAIGLVAAAMGALAATFAAPIAAIHYLGTLGAEVAGDLISGLVAGITSGGTAVVDAMTGLANSAIGAAKSALGISSPSKVFEQIGAYTGEGFAGGVEGETANAQAAMSALVAPPDAPSLDAATAALGATGAGAIGVAATGAGATGAGALNLSGATFVFNGVADAEQAEGRFGELLTRLLEGDAYALGAVA